MQVLRSFSELAAARNEFKGKLGLVPTMGALHAGHLVLVAAAKKHAEAVMVSIFVNPTQFAPGEDFAKYPRRETEDLKKLQGLADYVYLPKEKDIYPDGEKISVKAGKAAQGLESEFRPGHFDGVATVISILFAQIKPDCAVFGEKDFQQLMVIKEMNYPKVEIISVPTVREANGLAMSSRNIYLSAEQQEIASFLFKSLKGYQPPAHITGGEDGSTEVGRDPLVEVRENLEKYFEVQYVEQRWNRLLAAVYLGKTRLIDNIPLKD